MLARLVQFESLSECCDDRCKIPTIHGQAFRCLYKHGKFVFVGPSQAHETVRAWWPIPSKQRHESHAYVSLETSSFVSFSVDFAAAVAPPSWHPNVRSAMSFSIADLTVVECSSLRRRTMHGTSRLLLQFREMRVLRIPGKHTTTVQVKYLSKKSSLPSSHDLAAGSNHHSSKSSQPEVVREAYQDETTLKPIWKKWRVKLFSLKGERNTRPERENFDDVFPKLIPVCYLYRMVFIEISVYYTPELLQALCCFSRNPFCDCGEGLSHSLPVQF